MADKKISELDALTGANTADDDVLVIVDTSAGLTKKITLGELENALGERDFTFGDNDKAIFGAGSDLQIYHDGANSYIDDTGTGELRIRGHDKVKLQKYTGENFLVATADGSVTLNYDNAEKLATTSTGIDVTGTVTADGLTVDGDATIGQTPGADRTLSIGSAGALHFDIDTVGSTGRVYLNATNDSAAGKLHLQTAGADRLFINNNGDISFYEDTGTTAKFFWDASAESLGIGTTSPNRPIEINTASSIGLRVEHSDGGGSYFEMGDTSGSIMLGNDAGALRIFTGGDSSYSGESEAMRIDSSGNLLVGNTLTAPAASSTETGIALSSTGYVAASRSGDASGFFNRITSDGDIVQFRKDGSTVGSIGTYFGDLYIASPSSTDAGIGLGASKISPTTTTGALRDAAIDLGQSAGRFKDLYLSGGVYLGGTGSANKLDDYEEGTWTPSFINGTWTYSKQYGRYTKVGELVTIWYSIAWSARSGTGELQVTGLPFTPFSGDTSGRAGGSVGTNDGLDTSGNKQIIISMDGNLNKIFYRFLNDNAGWSALNLQNCETTGEVQGTFTYRA